MKVPPFTMSPVLIAMLGELMRPMSDVQKRLLHESLTLFAVELEIYTTAALQERLRQEWSETLRVMLSVSKN